MRIESRRSLVILSTAGLCSLLTAVCWVALPIHSAKAAADDSDSKKSASQKDQNSDKSANDNSSQQNANHNGRKAWIGVRLQETDNEPTPTGNAKDQNQKGVETTAIYPDGPAARAGLRQGDRIQSINGKSVSSPREVTDAIANQQPGAKAQIVVNRNGKDETLSVTLGDSATMHQQRAHMNAGYNGNFQQRSYSAGGNPQGFEQGQYGQGYAQGQQYEGPEHGMMLEYNRRNSEQHQRMESQIEELLQEVRALRKEVQQLKAK